MSQNITHLSSPENNDVGATGHSKERTRQNKVNSSTIQIVWQWLCYVLWSGTLIAMSILISASLTYYLIDKTQDYDYVIYVLAVMLALLPLALLADRIYRKQEPAEKRGFAAAVMVLHAFIVFMATLHILIAVTVTLLSPLVSSRGTDTRLVLILGLLADLTLGVMLFLRIINYHKLHRLSKLFPRFIVGTAGVLLVTAAGPLVSEMSTGSDKLIEDHLQTINRSIQDYTKSNDNLPSKLEDLALDKPHQKNAKVLIDKKLVEYRKVSDPQDIELLRGSTKENPTFIDRMNGSYKLYELCVIYKQDRNLRERYPGSSDNLSSIDTHSHEAGRQCYKQRAYLDDNYPYDPLRR